MNKFLIAAALLIMLAVAFYFSQNRARPGQNEPRPQIESLEGLNTELEAIIDE